MDKVMVSQQRMQVSGCLCWLLLPDLYHRLVPPATLERTISWQNITLESSVFPKAMADADLMRVFAQNDVHRKAERYLSD
jgi:hypothetical protein